MVTSIIAKTPPAIALVLGVMLYLAGHLLGIGLILAGIILQILWLAK